MAQNLPSGCRLSTRFSVSIFPLQGVELRDHRRESAGRQMERSLLAGALIHRPLLSCGSRCERGWLCPPSPSPGQLAPRDSSPPGPQGCKHKASTCLGASDQGHMVSVPRGHDRDTQTHWGTCGEGVSQVCSQEGYVLHTQPRRRDHWSLSAALKVPRWQWRCPAGTEDLQVEAKEWPGGRHSADIARKWVTV